MTTKLVLLCMAFGVAYFTKGFYFFEIFFIFLLGLTLLANGNLDDILLLSASFCPLPYFVVQKPTAEGVKGLDLPCSSKHVQTILVAYHGCLIGLVLVLGGLSVGLRGSHGLYDRIKARNE